MRYTRFRDVQISRLGIGTVQFGMRYGINNRRGKVPYPDILQILAASREIGVNLIDTSRDYGSSEEELGKAIAELDCAESFLVCTKLDLPPDFRTLDRGELVEAARRSMEESRAALHRDTIDFYLLHTAEYKSCAEGAVWEYLLEERRRGRIGHLGVSITHGPREAATMLDDPDVEALQIPFNLFDWRWKAGSIFDRARERGVALFTRSAYLQGLLVMELPDVVKKLPAAVAYREQLDEICKRVGLSTRSLALRYVFSTAEIHSTVVGVDSYEQFVENANLAAAERLDERLLQELSGTFQELPEEILNPALWSDGKNYKENRT